MPFWHAHQIIQLQLPWILPPRPGPKLRPEAKDDDEDEGDEDE